MRPTGGLIAAVATVVVATKGAHAFVPPTRVFSWRTRAASQHQQHPPELAVAVEHVVDDSDSGNGVDDVGDPLSNSGAIRWRERRRFLTILPLVFSATTAFSQASIAAVTGGRIGGGYTPPAAERTPSAPPMQQEQRYQAPQRQKQYQPRAGQDIYGSEGSRFHITYDGGRMGRRSARARFDPDAGDVPSSTITPGDVAMVGGVSAAVAAVQRYNRKRFLDEEGQEYGRPRSPALQGRADRKGSKQTAVVSTLQLSLWSDRTGGPGDVLAALDHLSQTADVNSQRGFSTLISEVRARFRSQGSFLPPRVWTAVGRESHVCVFARSHRIHLLFPMPNASHSRVLPTFPYISGQPSGTSYLIVFCSGGKVDGSAGAVLSSSFPYVRFFAHRICSRMPRYA